MEVTGRDERSRESLEVERLRLEILRLSKPWWKRTGTYAAFLPTLLAVATLIAASRSEFFDLEMARRDLREEQLAFDVTKLEVTRDSLRAESKSLASSIAELRSEQMTTGRRLSMSQDSLNAAQSQLRTIERKLREYIQTAASPHLVVDNDIQGGMVLIRNTGGGTAFITLLCAYLEGRTYELATNENWKDFLDQVDEDFSYLNWRYFSSPEHGTGLANGESAWVLRIAEGTPQAALPEARAMLRRVSERTALIVCYRTIAGEHYEYRSSTVPADVHPCSK